jgi:hypothetical protein
MTPEIDGAPDTNTAFIRWYGRYPLDILLPYTVEEMENLREAERLMQQEGFGLVVIINHFSKRDAVDVIKAILFRSQIIRERPIIAPIAYHQKKSWVEALGNVFRVKLSGIVTQDTIERGLNDGLPLNRGLDRFIADGLEVIRHGGTMVIAPQTKRRERLKLPEIPTIGYLTIQAERHGINNVAYLFVGVGIPGVTDYREETVGGINMLRRYSIRVGDTLTQQALLEEAAGNAHNIDAVVMKHLATIVPPEYRSPDNVPLP